MKKQHSGQKTISEALDLFRKNKGMMRMSAALAAGIHRATLRKMVDSGELQKVSRGLYQVTDGTKPSHPDLAIVAAKIPNGVICLISALAFHELTTQIPHEVYVAIGRNSEPPRLDFPPVRSFRFSGVAFTEGIESHNLGPVAAKIYGREKTISDCFKYRHKIGLDTCLEALRTYRGLRGFNVERLMKFATACRVANVIRPYVEALL